MTEQRRRFLRKQIMLPGKLKTDSETRDVSIIELSGEGCVLNSKKECPVNFTLEFHFSGTELSLDSERVWTSKKDSFFAIGVRFNIDSKTRMLIVDEILKEILAK